MTPRSRKVFLLLSLALLFADTAVVGISYYNARQAFDQSLQEQGNHLRAGFEVAYAATLSNMLQMATFIANDPHIQQTFLAGKRAVEREGGGAGGSEAARLRQALLKEVAPAWQRMTEQFEVRQLHFHLGPGSLSFLRVHKPEKFGDHMDDVRHIIVDTNADQTPRTGFETGRVYSGLRGVVPVWAEENGKRVYAGAVEVGTSFTEMYRVLDNQLTAGAATLLKLRHVEDNMWSSAIDTQFAQLYEGCNCAIEATSRLGIDPIIKHYSTRGLNKTPFDVFHSEHIKVQGKHFAVTYWPLYDYYALSRNTGEQVGAILMWRDIEKDIAAFNRSLQSNLLIAVVGFLLLELLIYWTVRLVTGRLEQEVALRTRELNHANKRLAALAQTDELTGLYNRRHFTELLDQEVERCQRLRKPMSLAMADLDYFKSVNDEFGHPMGDHVLQIVAGILRRNCREYDVLGRYGGEEMVIIFPETELATAQHVCERLREEIAAVRITAPDGRAVPLSTSIGIAQLQAGDNADELIDTADKALYQAKKEGRNRVCLAETANRGNSALSA